MNATGPPPASHSTEVRWKRTVDRRGRPSKLTLKRLLSDFGISELDAKGRATITHRLALVGLVVDPPLESAPPDAIVTLHVDPSGPSRPEPSPPPTPAPAPASPEPLPVETAPPAPSAPAIDVPGAEVGAQQGTGLAAPAPEAKPPPPPSPPPAASEPLAQATPIMPVEADPDEAPVADEDSAEASEGLDAAVGGAERASRILQERARSAAARLEQLERELAAERAAKVEALSEARALREASEEALRSLPSGEEEPDQPEPEIYDEPDDPEPEVRDVAVEPEVHRKGEARSTEPESVEHEAQAGEEEAHDARDRYGETREYDATAGDEEPTHAESTPPGGEPIAQPYAATNLESGEPPGKERRFRFGLRRRSKRAAESAPCSVCRRNPGTNEVIDLEAAGWVSGAEHRLCPDCIGDGWQLAAKTERPYRRALRRGRAD